MHSTRSEQLTFGLDALPPRRPTRSTVENRLTDYIKRRSSLPGFGVIVDEVAAASLDIRQRRQVEIDLYQQLIANPKRPKLTTNLVSQLSDKGLVWVYNGIENATSRQNHYAVPFVFNPNEALQFYAGVWRVKWEEKYESGDPITHNTFAGAASYIMQVNALNGPHFKRPCADQKTREGYYTDPLSKRLALMPKESASSLLNDLKQGLKEPYAHDFEIPPKLRGGAVDRKAYISRIVEKLNP